jgi:DNA-binding MarR family transcriptional regulator
VVETAPIGDSEIGEQAARLRLAIARTARRMRQSAGAEVGMSALAALATIDRLGPMTPSELAAGEGIQRPTATRILARLQEHGLIDRSPHPEDGRCSLISTTAEGRALLVRLRRRKTAYLARRLRGLGERDRATLSRAASILEQMLEEERA